MNPGKKSTASVVQYELEVEIQASQQRVWKAIIEETNSWWLPDFRMVGAGSVVSFDPVPGCKGLVEELDGGGSLQWYSVQYYKPHEFTIYLVGYIAPDWGGPSTSHLKLALEGTDAGCKLKVTDAQCGNVSEDSIQSLVDGWTQMFSEGLKVFVEADRK
jgi:uncharacterized protein YndB with AHSA1/START domain